MSAITHYGKGTVYPDLKDKVAIITGAGAVGDGIGNGRAVAINLAQQGARVVVVDLHKELADRTVEMISDEGGSAIALGADVSSEAGCQKIVDAALKTYGRVDLLENNVGIGSKGTILEETPDIWNRVVQVNLNSVYYMSRAVIPHMMKVGGGSIVNVSSLSAFQPRGLAAYTTTKGAILSMTRVMALNHAPDQIRVNCVAPGPIYSAMAAAIATPEQREARIKASPMGIEGNGWDVANTVLFFFSEASRYITGQTMLIDGGVSLTSSKR